MQRRCGRRAKKSWFPQAMPELRGTNRTHEDAGTGLLPTASNLDDMGVLQKNRVPFITELNILLTQLSEKLKESPGKEEVFSLAAAPCQAGKPTDTQQ
jgi:hypothetical protein